MTGLQLGAAALLVFTKLAAVWLAWVNGADAAKAAGRGDTERATRRALISIFFMIVVFS